ncbi:hypothetical protein [Cellulosimicrobium sp. CUA-896]|nr:hypothetical protein [Cellulosimicrobium sp. CUA-896]
MEGYELLIGVSAPNPGRFVRETVEVTYEADGSTRTISIPA